MNKQINYIIHAFLLILLLAAGYFVVNKIVLAELIEKTNVDYNNPVKPDSIITASSSQGKTLFLSKCASCHNIFKDMTGPALSVLKKEARGVIVKNCMNGLRILKHL